MADLPSATTTIDNEAGAFAGSTGYCVVFGCVATNADLTPRVFGSAKALLTQHGYAQGVDYVANHIEATKKPVIFIGLPVTTAGVLGRLNNSGVTGTSQVTVAAGASGYMDEVDASLTVVTGGTVGVNGITFNLSMDGGRTSKLIRLGTATSYTVPYLGIVISFGAGTLVAADTVSFTTTAPMWSGTDLATARTALAAQQKLARSWMIIGALPDSTFAGYVTTQANAYETSNDRYVYARADVKDRLPLGLKSKITKRMVGTPSLTFAEVGATGDTITRATGSWITDSIAAGDLVTVSGTSSNNFSSAVIASLSATVITLDTQDLVAETTSAATVTASPALTFAEVGATGDTITRSSGSWVSDGFAVGDTVTFSGTASNNVTDVIAALSATVMTFTSTDLAAEVIRSDAVTCTQVLTKASWISAMDSAFASVDAQRRIDLSAGRARKTSPITGWMLRRPASWASSIREYAHDLQIPCWRKEDGPLDGWDLADSSGNIVAEYDERTDAGALAARFTCFRTWANGPNGTYVALSLTRETEGSILSRTHNMAVANLGCTVVQAETERAIGAVLVKNEDGTATEDSLQKIEQRVNTALQKNMLQVGPEGTPRASLAKWQASRSDNFSVPGATLNGTFTLVLNGTVEQIATRVVVS